MVRWVLVGMLVMCGAVDGKGPRPCNPAAYFDAHDAARVALELYAIDNKIPMNEALQGITHLIFSSADPGYQVMTEKIVRKICRNHEMLSKNRIMFYRAVLEELDGYVTKKAVVGKKPVSKYQKYKKFEMPSRLGFLMKWVAIAGGVVIVSALVLHYIAMAIEFNDLRDRVSKLEARPGGGTARPRVGTRMMLYPDPSGGLMVRVMGDAPEPEAVPAGRRGRALTNEVVEEAAQQQPPAENVGAAAEPAPGTNAAPDTNGANGGAGGPPQGVAVDVAPEVVDAFMAAAGTAPGQGQGAAAQGDVTSEEEPDSGSDFDDSQKAARKAARVQRRKERCERRERRRCERVEQELRERIKLERLGIRRRENEVTIPHGRQEAAGFLGKLGGGAVDWWTSAKKKEGGFLDWIKTAMRPYLYGPKNELPKTERKRIKRYLDEMNGAELERAARGLGMGLTCVTVDMIRLTREKREAEEQARRDRYRVTKYVRGLFETEEMPLVLHGKYEYWCEDSKKIGQKKYQVEAVFVEEEVEATARMIIARALGQPIPIL